MQQTISALLQLSHELGREDRKLAILAEGNVSARVSESEFLVKASGTSLARLEPADLTLCRFEPVLSLLDRTTASDGDVQEGLMAARVDVSAKKPSVEAAFHAWLLSLEDVQFIGHCHPVTANAVLCSPRARDYAERRLFPDEVVCCGSASVFVPYTDPGIPLAREIRERTVFFMKQWKAVPRLVVLQNHGLIALGSTFESVLSCLLMAAKAAEIFVGAAALGGPNFMSAKDIDRIASRPDEWYRQRQLRL